VRSWYYKLFAQEVIPLHLAEIENHAKVRNKIARGFIKFCFEEKYNRPEKIIFRNVCHADTN
jgi:hypothetical protein